MDMRFKESSKQANGVPQGSARTSRVPKLEMANCPSPNGKNQKLFDSATNEVLRKPGSGTRRVSGRLRGRQQITNWTVQRQPRSWRNLLFVQRSMRVQERASVSVLSENHRRGSLIQADSWHFNYALLPRLLIIRHKKRQCANPGAHPNNMNLCQNNKLGN